MVDIAHPLPAKTRVQVLVANFDEDPGGAYREAPAGEFGIIQHVDYYGPHDGWAYTVVQEPSGVVGIWFASDFMKGEIALA